MRLSGQILIDEQRIQRRVTELAGAIATDTEAGTTLSVLALLDGAVMFCADLVRRLPMPVRLAMVRVISVDRGGVPERIVLPEGFPVADADVLVVEDILDTGKTLSALRDHLLRQHPARLRIAVLLDKPARRVVELKPDYIGFPIPKRWVVGYGLDLDGLYRNLPHITWVE